MTGAQMFVIVLVLVLRDDIGRIARVLAERLRRPK